MTDGTGLANVPKFEDLPAVDGTERHSWDVFGRDDEVGTVNFIGPEQVRAAAALVTTGDVVGLGLPLNEAARASQPPASRLSITSGSGATAGTTGSTASTRSSPVSGTDCGTCATASSVSSADGRTATSRAAMSSESTTGRAGAW